MRLSLKTIYSQLIISFIIIILLTISISTFAEYRTYTRKLPGLITKIRSDSIARNISSSYTAVSGWDNLAGEIQRLRELDSLNTIDDASLRIIIKDNDGKTVYNSFSELIRIDSKELIEGQSAAIIDYNNSETVGLVTIYISREYINILASDYISDLLIAGIYKSLITAAAAVLLSLLLSRRITSPIILLTKAAGKIADEGSSSPIEVFTSNETGKLSDAFNKMLSSLQMQRELRKQLLTDISHEINTPLNAIRLEARGLQDNLVAADEASTNIIHEIDKLKNIIYDLDWLSETDSGAYSINKQSCGISRLIREEAGRWLHKADIKNIRIINEREENDEITISADVIRIRTVLGNLIDNALKYSPEGSTVRLGYINYDGTVEVYVCDNGKAIAEEYREKIFERFFRAEESGNSAVPGRGLGLAISKQIAELHGGSLRLECRPGGGNCFRFTLPK